MTLQAEMTNLQHYRNHLSNASKQRTIITNII